VTKPFSLRELAARVRAVLRRMDKEKTGSSRLQNGELTLDRESRTVTVAGVPVDLTPSEFGLLAALLSNPGRVFSRSELLERIQGDAYEGYERTIDVHIRNLRAKIEQEGAPRQIETVYGAGYRLRGE
jgi:DNA-binding response OmpR family regulator